MKLLCWPLGPFFVLLFPDGIKRLGSDNLPTTFIQFLSVIIGSGVSSAFIFGVHANHWWVLSNKSFWVKTLLQCLLSELSLLSFLEFLQVKLLGKLPLFIIILVSLKLNNDVEDFSCLSLELIRVHGIKLKGLQSDAEGNLLLLGFLGFLFILLLSKLFFFFFLLLVQFLLLFSSDFFPLCLLFLQLLQLLFFLLPGLSPFCNVFLQLAVKSLLLLCFFSSVSHCDLLWYFLYGCNWWPLLLGRMTLLLMF